MLQRTHSLYLYLCESFSTWNILLDLSYSLRLSLGLLFSKKHSLNPSVGVSGPSLGCFSILLYHSTDIIFVHPESMHISSLAQRHSTFAY